MTMDTPTETEELDPTVPRDGSDIWSLRASRKELRRLTDPVGAYDEEGGMLGPVGGAMASLGNAFETLWKFNQNRGVQNYYDNEIKPIRDRVQSAERLADKAAGLIMNGMHPDAVEIALMKTQNMEVDREFGSLIDARLREQGFKDKFGFEPDFTNEYRNQADLMEEWVSSLPPIEASWDDVFNAKYLPVIGIIAEVRDARDLVKRMNRIYAGEEEGDDIEVVEKWLLEQYSPQTKGKQYVDAVMGTLSFAGELVATGGASAIGRAALKKLGGRVMRKVTEKIMLRSMQSGLLRKIAEKAGANTAVGQLGRAVGRTAETMVAEEAMSATVSTLTEGDTTRGFAERIELQDQLAKAIDLGINPQTGEVEWSVENNPQLDEISLDSRIKNFIELFSESLGGAVGNYRALKKGGVAAQTWPMAQRLYPGITRSQWANRIADAAKASQLGGAGGPIADLVAETAEEYAVRFMEATYGSATGDPEDRFVNWDEVIPKVDDAVMELAVIATPMVGGRVAGRVARPIGRAVFERPRQREMREAAEAIERDIALAQSSESEEEREAAQARVDEIIRRTRIATNEEVQGFLDANGLESVEVEDNTPLGRVAARLSESGVQVVPVRGGGEGRAWNGAYNPQVPGTIFLAEEAAVELENKPEAAERLLRAVGYHEALHDAQVVVGPEAWQELVTYLKSQFRGDWAAAEQAYKDRQSEDEAAGLTQLDLEAETPAQMIEENDILIHGLLTQPAIRRRVERYLRSNQSRWDKVIDTLFGWATTRGDARALGRLTPPKARDTEAETEMRVDGLTLQQYNRLDASDKIVALMENAMVQRGAAQSRVAGAMVDAADTQAPEEEQAQEEAEAPAAEPVEEAAEETVAPELDEWLATEEAEGAVLQRREEQRRGEELERARLEQEFGAEAAAAAQEQVARAPQAEQEAAEELPLPTPVRPQEDPQRYIDVDVDAPEGTPIEVGSRVRVRGDDMRTLEVQRLTGQGQQQRAKLSDGRSVPVRNLIPLIKQRQPGSYLEPVERMPIRVGATVQVPGGVKTEGRQRKVKGPLTVERITGPLGRQRAKLSDGRIVAIEDLRLVEQGPSDFMQTEEQRRQAERARIDALRSKTRFSPQQKRADQIERLESMRDATPSSPATLSPVEMVGVLEDPVDPFLRLSPRSKVPVLDRFDLPEMSRSERWTERLLDKFNRVEQFEDWIRNYGLAPEGDDSPISLIRRYPGRAKAKLKASERAYFRPIKRLMEQFGIDYDLASDYLAYRHIPEANEALKTRHAEANRLRDQADQLEDEIREERKRIADERKRLLKELRGAPTTKETQDIQRQIDKLDMDQAERREKEEKAAELRSEAKEIDPGPDAVEWVTTEEAEAWLEENSKTDQWAGLEKIGKIVDKMNAQTRDWMVESGLISRKQYDQWTNQFDHYVPMRAIEQETSWNQGRGGAGFDVRGAETQMRRGRKTRPDALTFSLQQHRLTINRSEKNRIGKSFLKLMTDFNGVVSVNDVTAEEMIARTDSRGRRNPAFSNLFYLKIDGKQKEVAIRDADLARAIKNLDPIHLPKFMEVIRKVTRGRADLLTTWNYGFFFPNFVKDFIQTQMISGELVDEGFQIDRVQMGKNAFRAVGAIRRFNREGPTKPGDEAFVEAYKEFSDAGGLIGVGAEARVDAVDQEMREDFASATRQGKWRMTLDWLEAHGDAFEQGNRLAVFMAMRDAGASPAKAAEVARGITVDFNRGGTWTSATNALYMFSNASLQGNARNIRAIHKSKRVQKMMGYMFLLGVMNDLLNAELSDEDDDGRLKWDNLGMWDRSFNFHLPGIGLKLPLPYFWNLPLAAGQEVGRALRGVREWGESATDIVGMASDTLMPVSVPAYDIQGIVQALMPTSLRPFVDVAVNRDFKGDKIYNTGFDSVTPDHTLNTDALPAGVTKFIYEMTGGDISKSPEKQGPLVVDINPRAMEYLFEEVLGGLGDGLANMSSTAVDLWNAGKVDVRDVSIVRRFASTPNPYGPVGSFYEISTELQARRKALRIAEEREDQSFAKDLKERYPLALTTKWQRRNNKVRQRLSELREERDALPFSDVKGRDALDEKRSNLAGAFVKEWDRALEQEARKEK